MNGEAEGADAIVSIRPSNPAYLAKHGLFERDAPQPDWAELDLAVRQAVLGDLEAVLVQCFDDIGTAAYGPYLGPDMDHAAEAIDFARRVWESAPEGLIVVHCEHGRSRSAAVALALLADAHGPGREAEAVKALLRQDIDGRMHPNPRLIALADAALYRYGRLDAALAAASPRYAKWKAHWAEAALDPAGHWERARKVRFRRKAS